MPHKEWYWFCYQSKLWGLQQRGWRNHGLHKDKRQINRVGREFIKGDKGEVEIGENYTMENIHMKTVGAVILEIVSPFIKPSKLEEIL